MTHLEKQAIIKRLESTRGDNLYRMRLQIARLSPKQRDEPWGESDQTPNEILKGYENDDQFLTRLIRAVENV